MSTIDIGVVLISTADNATSAYNEPTPINILNTSGQTITGVLSLIGPGSTFATAPVAFVLTAAKISADVKEGEGVNPGDLLSLTGDTVAIIGAIGLAIGAPVEIPVLAIGAALTMLGVGIDQGWIPWDFPNDIADAISNFFSSAQKWVPRRDPLTLDLNGNGLETIAPNATNPILFDMDGDGVKTGTGWVAPSDGFLVWDKNGNGIIDSGREMFGDAFIKADGTTAKDGFDALAALDSNGDGVVDANDANFSSLRVWQDTNQNGITDAGELKTLSSLGIASFKVSASVNSQVLPNGNQIADLGSYTKSDGTVATLGDVSQMADVNLATDTFHREFTDTIPLATGVDALPDMDGSGAVRDLRQAASQSTTLQDLLTQYSAATTRDAQMALLDQLSMPGPTPAAWLKDVRDPHYVIRYMAFGAVTRAQTMSIAQQRYPL